MENVSDMVKQAGFYAACYRAFDRPELDPRRELEFLSQNFFWTPTKRECNFLEKRGVTTKEFKVSQQRKFQCWLLPTATSMKKAIGDFFSGSNVHVPVRNECIEWRELHPFDVDDLFWRDRDDFWKFLGDTYMWAEFPDPKELPKTGKMYPWGTRDAYDIERPFMGVVKHNPDGSIKATYSVSIDSHGWHGRKRVTARGGVREVTLPPPAVEVYPPKVTQLPWEMQYVKEHPEALKYSPDVMEKYNFWKEVDMKRPGGELHNSPEIREVFMQYDSGLISREEMEMRISIIHEVREFSRKEKEREDN